MLAAVAVFVSDSRSVAARVLRMVSMARRSGRSNRVAGAGRLRTTCWVESAGRGGADAGLILGGALVLGVFWIIAFFATLAATAD